MEWFYYNSIPRTERGHAREEYYNGDGSKKEEFGLNKRTRREKRGIECSLPDGSWPETKSKAAGA